jgi:E3 ubiquitin-protein ligase SIAH1
MSIHDLSKDVLEQLQCPVCTQYMLPPITLCGNGHNICSSCKKKFQKCPNCREPLLDIRNKKLEKLALRVECPCPNEPHGCTLTFPIALIREHQEVCEYSPLECPLRMLVHCRWKEPFEEVKHNVTENTEIGWQICQEWQTFLLRTANKNKV